MVITILDSMPVFGAMTACFESCQPRMPQIGSFYWVPNLLIIDMNIDIIAKEKIILIFTTQTINKSIQHTFTYWYS